MAERRLEMPEVKPLPGAAALAKRIERRRFLRKAATAMFYGVVAVSSGSVGLATFLADPAEAAGACCPACCGPSPCCETSCCNKNCCAASPSRHRCVNNAKCDGFDKRYYSDACWSCTSGSVITVCCDCWTNNETGCPNPYATRRCICYSTHRAPPESAELAAFGPKNRVQAGG